MTLAEAIEAAIIKWRKEKSCFYPCERKDCAVFKKYYPAYCKNAAEFIAKEITKTASTEAE